MISLFDFQKGNYTYMKGKLYGFRPSRSPTTVYYMLKIVLHMTDTLKIYAKK
jgi:hypothetical protein